MNKKTILNTITDKQLIEAINSSKSLNEVYVKLGYKEAPNSYSRTRIKTRIVLVAVKYGIAE